LEENPCVSPKHFLSHLKKPATVLIIFGIGAAGS